MNSPPSIFTQPSESLPAVDIDGPAHFESTEFGLASFEPSTHTGLPRSRATCVSKASDCDRQPGANRVGESPQEADPSAGAATTESQRNPLVEVTASSPASPPLPPSPPSPPPSPPPANPTWTQQELDIRPEARNSDIAAYKLPAELLSASRPRPRPSHLERSRSGPTPRKRPAPSDDDDHYHHHHSNNNNKKHQTLRHHTTGTGLQLPKVPRFSPDDPDLLLAFNRVDYASLRDGHHDPFGPPPGPVSPLFFSNNPRARPPLAPRFNSGEASASLFRNIDMEEPAGSGAVRTVKLARGSVSPPVSGAGPHAMARTPSITSRIPNHRRSSSSRDTTPDERDRDAIIGGFQSLTQTGLLELLDQDDRPTFVLDLSYRSNFQPGPLHLSFTNQALRAYDGLMDQLRGKGSGDATAFSPTSAFPEFKQWATSFVANGEAMDVILPSYAYSGFSWKVSTIRKRFRFFSGVPANPSIAMQLPPVRTPGTKISRPSADSKQEEPTDYFGAAVLSPLHESVHENESSPASSHALTPVDRRIQVLGSARRAHSPMNLTSEELKDAKDDLSVTTVAEISRSHSPLGRLSMEAILQASSSGDADWLSKAVDLRDQSDVVLMSDSPDAVYYFDWTRLPIGPSLPRHIRFARSIDWANTSLGPIEDWSGHLRATSCLIMASPHPAAMYWGDDYVALYNEPYILLAGQKHPHLMGTPYPVAWAEIWDDVKDSFAQARLTGQSTMKDDDRLFINRSGFLEETYFSWSIIPLVGDDGTVVGLYNPAFEKTRRKIAERRMLTLREVGEKTAAAREVKSFWGAVLKALEYNEFDTPFVLLYSVADEDNSDGSSIHSNSIASTKQVILEGTLPELPPDHPAAPTTIDMKSSNEGFAPIFREALMNDKHILLETANGTLDPNLLDNMAWRGFNEKPRAAVVSPIHPTTGESIIGFLVMGVNPRRPYDDDYNLFVTLLTRQLATSMASVVLFEEEIRRGQRAAKLAALDRIELSEQLEARTREAIESETKFQRMAEFAPVGIFIANGQGAINFTNGVFHSLTHLPKDAPREKWMELVKDEDKHELERLWDDVLRRGLSGTAEIRFKGEWKGGSGVEGDLWVLCSVFAEKYPDGVLKSIFGSLTDISKQKWAEGFQIKRTEEAIELKRQQSNFIDMTSHEMRNPLSAILQSADEIAESLIEFKNSESADQIPVALIDSNIDAAQTISLCANHQTRIVSDVLTLSKLDSALLLVTPVDSDPKLIVQQAMKMFEGELQTADITLNLQMEKSIDELGANLVRLDPSRLLQVLINLMTNAIKFTTPEPRRTITIKLSAHKERPSQSKNTCVDYIPRLSKSREASESADWGTGELLYLHFAVQDTGKGLTESEKKLLFQRFSQANPKTHVQYGGSGLGLFISRELVELQGGEIGVSSESGKGSTFAFYVRARKSSGSEGDVARSPATNGTIGLMRKPSVNTKKSRSPSSTLAPPPPVPSLPPGVTAIAAVASRSATSTPASSALAAKAGKVESRIKVLIVEDNEVNQKVLAKQLRNIGCEVSVANHGEEALAYLRRTRYFRSNAGTDAIDLGVILMDLEMPIMDGLTCTRRIREMEAAGELEGHSPIIAVSANARSAHIESAIEAGMDDVVCKPFRIPELVPKMEQLVVKYRSEVTEPAMVHREDAEMKS